MISKRILITGLITTMIIRGHEICRVDDPEVYLVEGVHKKSKGEKKRDRRNRRLKGGF